jgi:type II secretory pathway predicted ATPase ExeA
MYESFYHLRERPFCYAPRTDLYYPAAAIEAAYQRLSRCIDRVEGPALVIGGPGTGKSLLCQRLADLFRDRLHIALLNSAQVCTRQALLQSILFELGLPYRGLEEGELRLSLMDFLDPARSSREGLLLLVDEAHTLPLRLMEELRMITNLVRDGQPRVRLVLAGGPILEERFANPKMECFNQRIAARCYLQPLNYDETCQYVRSQIAAVGGDPDAVFTADALQAVYQATDGIPRLVNQLCDHALVLAAVGQHQPLDVAVIQEAWADLQQLPTPWQATVREASTDESLIEFGSLEPDAVEDVRPAEAPATAPERALLADDHVDDTDVVDLGEQLDELESQVAALQADDVPEYQLAPSPSSTAAYLPVEPEPAASEAVPQRAVNPFGEDFEDEEIVVDRYAALDAASRWFEPEKVGPHLPENPEPAAVSMVPSSAESRAPEGGELHRAKVLRALPPDDSDLIVIVDDERGLPRDDSAGEAPCRQEYRQLFSRLRQS